MKTLVEKYRPNSINEVFLDEKNMNCIQSFIDKQNFPSLLFYGPSGTGYRNGEGDLQRKIQSDGFRTECQR
jgi:replication-associated recombination protein RarA